MYQKRKEENMRPLLTLELRGRIRTEFKAFSETQSRRYTITTISSNFNKRMFLARMSHKPSAGGSAYPLSPPLAIRLNGLIQTATTEA